MTVTEQINRIMITVCTDSYVMMKGVPQDSKIFVNIFLNLEFDSVFQWNFMWCSSWSKHKNGILFDFNCSAVNCQMQTKVYSLNKPFDCNSFPTEFILHVA